MKKMSRYSSTIFIFLSFIFIMGSILFYGNRLVYYYRLENPKEGEVVTNLNKLLTNKVVYEGTGLREDSTGYYFYGSDVDNYILYSGRLFRIISIDSNGNIKIISDEVASVIYSGSNGEFVNKWLKEEYLPTLNKSYLVKSVNCSDVIDEAMTCDNTTKSDISLLSINDYSKAGDKNSYLNNGNYYWLDNVNSDGNSWYVDESGLSSIITNKVSLGVRPVVTLKANIDIVSGDGTLDEPYKIEETNFASLNDLYVGSYVKYSDYLWRIISNEENTKLILMDDLDEQIYSKSGNTYEINVKNTVAYYLNNTFYKGLDNKDYIIKNKWCNGVYESNYSNITDDFITSYVGLPSIGDMVVSGTYFTMTLTGKATQAIYVVDNSRLQSVDIREKYVVKPVILLDGSISIEEGQGTFDNPFIVK